MVPSLGFREDCSPSKRRQLRLRRVQLAQLPLTPTLSPKGGKGASHMSGLHRLVEVGDQVLNVLDADGEAHHFGTGARFDAVFIGKLAMGRGSRMDDQTPRVADIGEM